MEKLAKNSGVPKAFLRAIPTSFLNAFYRRNSAAVGPDFDEKELDSAARVHLVATGIPNDPQLVPIYRYIGLDRTTIGTVFPYGSDGLVDRNNAMAIGPYVSTFEPWHTIFGDEAIAHTLPRLMGTTHSQTTSPALAHHILDLLDEPDSAGRFRNYSGLIRRWERRWGEAPHIPEEDELQIQQAAVNAFDVLTGEIFGISPLRSVQPAFTSFSPREALMTVELTFAPPPEQPILGDVSWLAEVIGSEDPSGNGLSLETAGQNGRDLTLTVDEGVLGDVLVYASYQTTDGKRVLAQPYVAARIDPPATAVDSIEIEFSNPAPPDDPLADEPPSNGPPVFLVKEAIAPVLMVNYTDGTRFQRALTGDSVQVSSGDPAIIDVSDPRLWEAVGPGTGTVTVSAFGQTVDIQITLEDPAPPESYSAWKARTFSPTELADPGITGDTVDLDQDGLNLVSEYLFGGDPAEYDAGRGPNAFVFNSESGEQMGVGFVISNSVTGLGGNLQFSPDFTTWTDLLSLPLDEEAASNSNLTSSSFPSETRWILEVDSPSENGGFRLVVDPE